MESASNVRLEPVTADNRDAVLALALPAEQQDFVATNKESLKEAKRDRDARPRAVTAGERVVGFLMYDAPADDDEAVIYRFMIDQSEQGRGYGRAALQAVLAEIGALRHVRSITVCFMPDNEAAARLYHRAGFVDEGLDEDGEMISRLTLPGRRR